MTKKRWLWGGLLGLLLLALVANHLVRRFSFESFEREITERLSLALGVDVDIAGEARLELLPKIRMDVTGLTIATPPGTRATHLLEVEHLWFDLRLLPLLRGVVEVGAVDVSHGVLSLETDSEGDLILPPGLEDGGDSLDEQSGTHSFRIHGLGLEEIRVAYTGADGVARTIDFDRLLLEADEFDGPIRAEGEGTYRDRHFEIVGDAGRAVSLVDSSEEFPMDLELRFKELSSADGIRAHLKGSVRDVAGFAGVDLDIAVDGDALSLLEPIFDLSLPQGPLTAAFRLSDADGTLGADGVSIEMQRPDAFEFNLHGGIADIRNIDGIDVVIDFAIQDLAETGALFEADLPQAAPISGKGRIRGTNEHLDSNGTLQVGETRFGGDLNARFGNGRRTKIDGTLESTHVRLVDFGLAEAIDRRSDEPYDAPSLLERWWTGGEALPVEILREVDLDLTLKSQLLTGRGGFKLEPIRGDVDLEGGLLSVQGVRGVYDEGRVEGTLRVDARPKPALWSLQVEAYNVNITRTIGQFSVEAGKKIKSSAGKFDVSADLTSRGSTRAEMATSLDGRAGAMLRDGDLISSYSQDLFFDYLRFAVPDFLKLRGAKEGPGVRCMIVVTPISKGVADIEQFFFEGDRITIAGTGTVDLGKDELNVRLAPRVEDPGLVSVTATVDVTGPIGSPKFTPLARSVAKNVGRALFKNALRPVTKTLGATLRRNSKPTEDPCEAAVAQRMSGPTSTGFGSTGAEVEKPSPKP